MKVLLINTFYLHQLASGAARFVQIFAESLARHGHQVAVIARDTKSGLQLIRNNDVNIYYIGSHLKPSEFYQIIKDIFDKERPNLIHSNALNGFSGTLLNKLARGNNYPWLHTLHEYFFLCQFGNMRRDEINCLTQCNDCKESTVLRKQFSNMTVEAVVGVSEAILDRHLEAGYFKTAPIRTVIYNPYDADDTPLKKYSANGPLRLGFLGRLVRAKGIIFLLDMLNQHLNPSKWELYIGGEGPCAKALLNRYKAANIHYLGYVNPQDFFAKIDVLVVPSLWNEPQGRVILESYAYGIPVIASNRGGIPEIVEEKRTGFLFDPDRPETLISTIRELYFNRSLLHRMGNNAKSITWKFSSKQITKDYLVLYELLLG